ncbi:DNA methyltransferase [Bosea sp. UNC402CLCol]|uniref:DNA modification methylase n=1 Tax=Bosea sp. UNC402CLCol TaxID=1510531 RepID=UPI00068F3399|nr:DNA methyltransferase [Bosea sp. UNC402CLCol]
MFRAADRDEGARAADAVAAQRAHAFAQADPHGRGEHQGVRFRDAGHDCKAGEIVAGHGRYEAAKLLGIKQAPVVCLDHLDLSEIRALRLADNRLAELSGWDEEILKLELGALIEVESAVEFTGFETGQIDVIPDGGAPSQAKADPADALPELAATAVGRRGDLWLLGEHRILCGDARHREAYVVLMGEGQAQMVFTDPPYNVPISGHGKIKHREFAMAAGEMTKAEFTAFLQEIFTPIATSSQDGALIFACIDGPHLHEMLNAGFAVFDELKGVITWDKTMGGLGSLYRSQTELIPLWKKRKASHINNIEFGRHGRYRTTLWSYPGVNGFRKGRMTELTSHPTVKPCALVMDAIKDCSKPKGIILDPFGGSGTTLIAAHKTRRRGFLMEIDPHKRIMAISYAQELSLTRAAGFRSVVLSGWYRRAFPHFAIAANRGHEIKTMAQGCRFASSVGGSVLGRGADLIIIDDPINGLEAQPRRSHAGARTSSMTARSTRA